jgi:hypothetical protein
LLTILAIALTPNISAAEIVWDGHYRADVNAFHTLSLAADNENAEGFSALVDHQLQLRPTFAISQNVAFHTQVDILNQTTWGASADAYSDSQGNAIPSVFSDGVDTSDTNMKLTRAWADVYTDYGRLRFGRMPLEWGAGILLNPGTSPDSEFGDTSDRIQFTSLVGSIYVVGALDIVDEGFYGVTDDFQIANVALAYQTETIGIGLLNRYRFQPSSNFSSYTGDLWAKANLGTISAELELALHMGGGDLSTGENDISIFAWGGIINLSTVISQYVVGLEIGVATGDDNLNDSEFKTFAFDRDYNRAFLMFEEPMPVMAAAVMNEANGGRDYDAVRTGEGISNAQYLRPYVGFTPMDGVVVEASAFMARADMLPDTELERSYGSEYDLSVSWTPYDKFTLTGTGAVLTPGGYYSGYEHEELGGGFGDTTYGGRLMATVDF